MGLIIGNFFRKGGKKGGFCSKRRIFFFVKDKFQAFRLKKTKTTQNVDILVFACLHFVHTPYKAGEKGKRFYD